MVTVGVDRGRSGDVSVLEEAIGER